jgi:hypothetical protein
MTTATKQFAICIDNSGHESSLILGKVYSVLTDARAARDDLVRIVDESGDDYLFAKSAFVFVEFPDATSRILLALRKAG